MEPFPEFIWFGTVGVWAGLSVLCSFPDYIPRVKPYLVHLLQKTVLSEAAVNYLSQDSVNRERK